MKKDNRICICCGKAYKYCSSCAEYASLPTWKNIYDEIECKVIFDVATDYLANSITKEEAKKKLNAYDIKNITMKESIAKVINEILGSSEIEKVNEVVNKSNALVKDNVDTKGIEEVKEKEEETKESNITSTTKSSFIKYNKKK